MKTADAQIASDLGRPPMVTRESCDIEPLGLDDFEPSDSLTSRLFIMERMKLSELRKYT